MASTIVVDKIKKTGGVAFELPIADGAAGQLLKTDGNQGLGWATDVDTGITSVAADTTPQLGGDLDCAGSQIQWSKGADVASATALVLLTDGNYFDVTGTATITSFNTTGGPGTQIKLHFIAACTLTHDSTDLKLPGGANITTAAGDTAEFIEYAAGDYICTSYTKASGKPIITDFANADISASAAVAVTKIAAMPYDLGFTAGFDSDMVKEDVAVATYGEMVVARALTITGETAYVDTVPTGTTLIMDVMKNNTTIYASTKPLFAISTNTHTAGVATTTALVAGDRLTFKITQVGSSEPGEGVRFTLKCKTNTNE